MATIKEMEEVLKQNMKTLKNRYKVNKIGIFGSYVRGEQTRDSDVDILVELSEPIGWEFVDLKEYLENILGVQVDLVTINALKSQIKDDILTEVVYA